MTMLCISNLQSSDFSVRNEDSESTDCNDVMSSTARGDTKITYVFPRGPKHPILVHCWHNTNGYKYMVRTEIFILVNVILNLSRIKTPINYFVQKV